MGVDHGGFHIAVAEQFLNRTNVGAMLQNMCGKRMAEGVAGRWLLIPAACTAARTARCTNPASVGPGETAIASPIPRPHCGNSSPGHVG
jgi:hypothetical protein